MTHTYIDKEVSVTDLWKNETNKLLNKLLEIASSIPEIDFYLSEETKQLKNYIQANSTLVDFGCGNGRHLEEIKKDLKRGLGIDMNATYLQEARRNCKSEHIKFIQDNIENFKAITPFDYAIAMYNTVGVVKNPNKVIKSMLSSVKKGGHIVISLYSEESIPYRVKMYELIGLKDIKVTKKEIYVEQGFITRHYNWKDVKALFPTANINRCSEIGWFITYKKV